MPERLLMNIFMAEIMIMHPTITAKMRSKKIIPVKYVRAMAAMAPEFEYKVACIMECISSEGVGTGLVRYFRENLTYRYRENEGDPHDEKIQ